MESRSRHAEHLMEQAMFDLKEAIGIWRKQAATHVPSEALEELEAHLQDAVEARIDEGMKAEEAFVLATHQLGNLQHVGKEISHELGKSPANLPDHRPWMAFAMAALLCVATLFGVECFRAYSVDRYESQVAFEVHPKKFGGNTQIFDNKTMRSEEVVDLATELEVIRSHRTLYQSVDELKLDEEWEIVRPEALARVKNSLTVERIGDSNIVRLRYADSGGAQLVANIANSIAAAYQNRTMTLGKNRMDMDLDMLQRQLKDQSEKVEEARLRMLDLAERYRFTPGDEDRIKQAEEKMATAVQEIQLALVDASGEGEREVLNQKLAITRDMFEGRRDDSMDFRRKAAEYREALGEYDLQSEMFSNMQETYAKGHVIRTMPLVPITIHESGEIATSKLSVNWSDLWFSVFAKGWPWIIGSVIVGWWIVSHLRLRQRRTFQEVLLLTSVTQTKDEISWA